MPYDGIPENKTIYTSFIHTWFWPTLMMCDACRMMESVFEIGPHVTIHIHLCDACRMMESAFEIGPHVTIYIHLCDACL